VNTLRFGTAIVTWAHDNSVKMEVTLQNENLLHISMAMTGIPRASPHANQRGVVMPLRIHKE